MSELPPSRSDTSFSSDSRSANKEADYIERFCFFSNHRVTQGKVSSAKMAESGTVWKSDYPRRHIYFLGTLGLLLGLGIIVLEVSY